MVFCYLLHHEPTELTTLLLVYHPFCRLRVARGLRCMPSQIPFVCMHRLSPPAGNIATLSFGALAINDVFAAVITLLFCEVVTHLYRTDTTNSYILWFMNCFKQGLIASLLADAAKLGS